MSNKEILEKAIEKAIERGYDAKLSPLTIPRYANLCLKSPWTEQLIFNHEFAKALWPEKGNGIFEYKDGKTVPAQHWRYHLKCMVIADDPIKYLGEHM